MESFSPLILATVSRGIPSPLLSILKSKRKRVDSIRFVLFRNIIPIRIPYLPLFWGFSRFSCCTSTLHDFWGLSRISIQHPPSLVFGVYLAFLPFSVLPQHPFSFGDFLAFRIGCFFSFKTLGDFSSFLLLPRLLSTSAFWGFSRFSSVPLPHRFFRAASAIFPHSAVFSPRAPSPSLPPPCFGDFLAFYARSAPLHLWGFSRFSVIGDFLAFPFPALFFPSPLPALFPCFIPSWSNTLRINNAYYNKLYFVLSLKLRVVPQIPSPLPCLGSFS